MSVETNLNAINFKIKESCRKASKNMENVTLVAVSKRQPIERIEQAIEAGHRVFGENIIQDAQTTWEQSGIKDKNKDIKLHFIGSLQKNKVKDTVKLFDCIETIDRPKLVDAIVKEAEKQNKDIECFIQVNTGEEDQKSGISPSELPRLLKYAKEKGLNISGLMCLPPLNEPSALHFAFLKELAEIHNIKNLSMGMSNDFEKAIPLNASHIRVGTAIFGERS